MDTHGGELTAIDQVHSSTRDTKELPSSSTIPVHGTPEVTGIDDGAEGEGAEETVDAIQKSKGGWFAYLRTREFYLVLLLGYGLIRLPNTAPRRNIIC